MNKQYTKIFGKSFEEAVNDNYVKKSKIEYQAMNAMKKNIQEQYKETAVERLVIFLLSISLN